MAAERKSASNSLSRKELLATLNVAKAAIGKGQFVPVLSHFCFTGESVIACDDVITIGVTMDTPLTCACPADLLLKLLNSLSADDLAFDTSVAGKVALKCGKSNLKVPCLPPKAFVHKLFDAGIADAAFDIDEMLLLGLAKCLVSVGNDPTQPIQMGITLQGGEKCFMYSTDNVTMSRYRFDADLPETSVVLPTPFCMQLIAMAKAFPEEEISAYLFDRGIHVRFGGKAFLQSKLIQVETVLDFAAVFESNVSRKVIDFCELPSVWDAAFSRAASVVSPQMPIASMSIDDEGVCTLTGTSQFGETEDVFDLALDKGTTCRAIDFNIDPNHVLRAAKVTTKVAFAKGSMLLKDGAFTHLISHCVKK